MSTTPTFKRDPKFGYDPWLGPVTPEEATAAHVASAARIYAGADTIGSDIGLLPAGLDAYMSYVDNFGGYPQLVARFGAHFAGLLLSITIFGNRARCADVEPGAMHASDFAHWYDHVALRDGGQLPWGYASASSMQSLIEAAAGRPFVKWSAHFGQGPHICGPHTCGFPQADWTQWTDTGPQGQNFDRSIGTVLPHAVTPPPPPKPKPLLTEGVLRFAGELDTVSGQWAIRGVPGHAVTWGTDKRKWASKLTVQNDDGHWSVTGLPFE